jgi:hypothetical protein
MNRLKYHSTDNINKFRNNITKNNTNYSITHYIIKNKIYIILKYSNIHSDEIYEFSNLFSFEMLQDINEYFTQFINIHQISIDLDKLLKNNDDIFINEFKGNLILSIVTIVNNQPKEIALYLFQNKLPDFKLFSSRVKKSKSKFVEFLRSAFRTRNKTELADSKKVKKYFDSPLFISKNNENIILSYNTHTNANEKDGNTISNKINQANTATSQMNTNYFSHRNNDITTTNNKEIKESMTNLRTNYLKNKEQYRTFYNNLDTFDENNIDFYSQNVERGTKRLEESKKQKERKTRKTYELEKTMSDLNEFQTNRSTKRTFLNTRNEFSPENNKNSGIKYSNIFSNRKKIFSPMSDKNERKLKYVFREIDNYYETLKPNKLGEEKKVFEIINEEDKKNETDNTKNEDKTKEPELPMVEREDLYKYVTSNIFFTKKELKLVKTKITKGVKGKHAFFDLLYRASDDGDYESTILSFCEGIYPQLILFHTSEGARFGVYIEKEKVKSIFGNTKYKEKPGTSFLVSLNSLKIYDIEKGEIATGNRIEKLCFGRSFYFNENGSNWFIFTPRNYFLDIKCMIGDKKSTFGNINTNEIVGPKKEYYLQDVEIFHVRLETNFMNNKSSSMKDIKSVKS